MNLIYTGKVPVTFTDPRVGEVFPGDQFEVADDLSEVYLTRSDVAQPATTGAEIVKAASAVVDTASKPEPETESTPAEATDQATTDNS